MRLEKKQFAKKGQLMFCNDVMLTARLRHCFCHTLSQSTVRSIIYSSLHPDCSSWQTIECWVCWETDRWHNSAAWNTKISLLQDSERGAIWMKDWVVFLKFNPPAVGERLLYGPTITSTTFWNSMSDVWLLFRRTWNNLFLQWILLHNTAHMFCMFKKFYSKNKVWEDNLLLITRTEVDKYQVSTSLN